MKGNLDDGLTVTMIPIDSIAVTAPPTVRVGLDSELVGMHWLYLPTVGVCCAESIFCRCVLALTVLSGCV